AGRVREFLHDEGEKLRRAGEAHYYKVRERFNSTPSSLDFLFLNRPIFARHCRICDRQTSFTPIRRTQEGTLITSILGARTMSVSYRKSLGTRHVVSYSRPGTVMNLDKTN